LRCWLLQEKVLNCMIIFISRRLHVRVNSASSSKCALAALLLASIGLFPLKPLFAESFPSDGCSYGELIKKARASGCETYSAFQSSWVLSSEYCPKSLSGALILSTKTGGEYIFKNVPKELFEGFRAAPSKGKFYHQFLKGDLRYQISCER
jgi:hypothetical protein